MENNVKQVIVIRKDLKMRKGKMVAQGAHASMKAILDQGYADLDEFEDGGSVFILPMSQDMEDWLAGLFTKICVGVDSEEELRNIYEQAIDAKLPCSLIKDSGRTEFDGVATFTAVAVGPARNEEVDKITKHLKLL